MSVKTEHKQPKMSTTIKQTEFAALGEMSQAIMKSAGLAPKKEEEEDKCDKCSVVVNQDNFYRDEYNNKNYERCYDCGIDEEEDEDEDEDEDEWCYENHTECICEAGGCAKPRDDEEDESDDEDQEEEEICPSCGEKWTDGLCVCPENCIKVPDYDKHKLDKTCYICGIGHMQQAIETPARWALYYQLTELTNGKYMCDGDECFDVMIKDC